MNVSNRVALGVLRTLNIGTKIQSLTPRRPIMLELKNRDMEGVKIYISDREVA